MGEWLWLWLVAWVCGFSVWLMGGELWSRVRDLKGKMLAASVLLFGGTLMVMAVPLALVGSGTGG